MNETLPALLQRQLAGNATTGLCVAFSGGPDSAALLHALAGLSVARARGLRALHVDHGLHADSARWAQRCADLCKSIDVPFTVARVHVEDARGEGIEAAARRARYAAFAQHLHAGEWLALAHHRDDQIETVLLKLLRGGGPEGLAGMRELRPFRQAFLWRPLLGMPRDTLRAYLAEHALTSIDDPANADPRFARNVLRRELLPSLSRHWPDAGVAILHAAQRCRDAADYIDAAARAASVSLQREARTLDARGWLALPPALRAPVLDEWLRARGLPTPPDAPRAELARQIAHAAPDRAPVVSWRGAEIHVWDGRLHATPPLGAPPSGWEVDWDGSPLALPGGCGVSLAPAVALDVPLRVRLRRGGERIRPAGHSITRDVGDVLREARLPPWLRTYCPLIYRDDELIAVADLCASDRGAELFARHHVLLCWSRPDWA